MLTDHRAYATIPAADMTRAKAWYKDKLGLSETFGARNLAAYPEGRAITWRRFVGFLDQPSLAPAQHAAVLAGAAAAYGRFGDLLRRRFPLD